MIKRRTFTGLLSAVFVLTLVSSARADVVHADLFQEKLISVESLSGVECGPADLGYLYADHFDNTGGRHIGFSMTAVTRGPRLGIVKPVSPSVSQNPEPTAMVLLGTGLAAVAALARKKGRRRRE